MEQFGNHRTYSAEMCRSCLSAKSLGQIVHIHIGAEIIKVHFAVFRMETVSGEVLCAVAVYIGKTRLIDNFIR